jgi:peptide/nickel transport system substrate-binding protein
VILRDSLAQLNIKVKLQKLPPAALADLVQSGDAEFAMWADAPFHPEPSFALGLWFQSDSCCNWQNYSNPEVDQQLADCGTIPDVEERVACYEPIQRTISEDSPQVWILQPDFSVGLSKRVEGWGWDPNQFYPIAEMSLTE